MPKKSKPIYISPSALMSFCTCPATLHFSQLYRRKEEEGVENFGSRCHKLMELGQEPTNDDTSTVKGLYPKLKRLEAQLGLLPGNPKWREVRQRFELFKGCTYTRIIDRLAQLSDGTWILCDWKTSMSPFMIVYKGKDAVAPKAMTLQAPGYLIPPPNMKQVIKDLELPENFTWPTQLVFAVAPMRSGPQVFTFNYDAEAEQNFYNIARWAVNTIKKSPVMYNRGPACKYSETWSCGFLETCFKKDGWEALYSVRNDDGDLVDIEVD